MSNYGPVVTYLLILVGFALIGLWAAALFRRRGRFNTAQKYETYECGEIPVGDAWTRFRVGYYLLAIVFILFDVETAFLFPWAVSLRKLGALAFAEMILFIAILVLGWLYAFRKGDLEWK